MIFYEIREKLYFCDKNYSDLRGNVIEFENPSDTISHHPTGFEIFSLYFLFLKISKNFRVGKKERASGGGT